MSQGFTVPGLRDNQVTDDKLRDSSALSVIGRSANSSGDPADISGATVGHVLQVLSGPTVGFGLAPLGNAVYNPDAGPTGAWAAEEFAGGAESLTWRWGNQGSSTISYVMDSAFLQTPTSGTSIRARWVTPPSGSFFAAMKMALSPRAINNLGGLVVLETGSEATPTSISCIVLDAIGSGTFAALLHLTKTSYTSGYAVPANYAADTGSANFASPFYFGVSFTSGSNSLRYWKSQNGMLWRTDSNFTRSLGGAPVSIGYMVDANSGNPGLVMQVMFFRIWDSEIQVDLESSGTGAIAYAAIGS